MTQQEPRMNLTLVEKELLVDNVWAFRFKADPPFTWVPGQFIQVELPHDHPDAEGTKRWFTVSSAPSDGLVQITTRVTQTTFKQALAAVPVGGQVPLLAQPEGDFIWTDTDRPQIWVAGGIGITPFRSILRQRFHDHASLAVTLVYGSRRADVPFKDEIDQWSTDPAFQVQYVVGQPLTPAKLIELNPHLNDALVYVSGPEPMVETSATRSKPQASPRPNSNKTSSPTTPKPITSTGVLLAHAPAQTYLRPARLQALVI
jgi:ferredoxin-NADP reductase